MDLTDLQPVVKAHVIDVSVPAPTAAPSDRELAGAFVAAGALQPPYDPKKLCFVYERSSLLQPCVDAIATNVDRFGYRLEPVIDLKAADADDRVRDALIQDRIATGGPIDVTDEDVASVRKEIETTMLAEKAKLTRFLDYANPSGSFVKLRDETRRERESTGNAYWEMPRRGDNTPASFSRIDTDTMRLRPVESSYIDAPMWQRRSPLAYEKVMVPRRFRTFVQLSLGLEKVYFKEFGDPRTYSSRTGRRFLSLADLQAAEGADAQPATEVIHWRIFAPGTPYGVPRWVQAQHAVLGVMKSEKVNHDWFDEKCIPALAISVSGGKLREGALPAITEHMRGLKGIDAYHKVLVLEAEGTNGKCKIEFHHLRQAQQEDALFQEYERNSAVKVQQQYRLPDLLVGRSQEVNRAQAEAALEQAEQQVFQPLRADDDDFMNRWILPELGIRFWSFVTNSVVAKDPAKQTDIGTAWVKAGVLTPNEGRKIAGQVLNEQYATIKEEWAQRPQPVVLAGVGGPVSGSVSGETGDSMRGDGASLAQRLVTARDALREQAAVGAAVEMQKARASDSRRVVKIDAGTWSKWFEPEAA